MQAFSKKLVKPKGFIRGLKSTKKRAGQRCLGRCLSAEAATTSVNRTCEPRVSRAGAQKGHRRGWLKEGKNSESSVIQESQRPQGSQVGSNGMEASRSLRTEKGEK